MSVQNTNVDQLNSFLRGEMSAVETYRQAIEKLPKSTHTGELAACKQSHEARVAILTDVIHKLGGVPAQSSGAWGTFAKLIEGGATALGEKVAIAALEEGEDHGNRDYEGDVPKLAGEVRMIVESRVLPLQRSTHTAKRTLKSQLS